MEIHSFSLIISCYKTTRILPKEPGTTESNYSSAFQQRMFRYCKKNFKDCSSPLSSHFTVPSE